MSGSLRPHGLSLSGSSVHRILQVRILEWVAISPGDLPNPGIEPGSPPLRVDALPSEPPGKPFSYLEPVCCSMSSSNCCFLTCIQISQEAGQVVWYSHLFQNFPQCIVIHTVKGFGIVNKAEIDVFLELSCFFNDPVDVGNLISGSSAFSKASLNIWKFMVHVLLKPALENFEHYFTSV